MPRLRLGGLMREIDPPPGENIRWRLLTTHPVEDIAQAFAIVELYRRRWARPSWSQPSPSSNSCMLATALKGQRCYGL